MVFGAKKNGTTGLPGGDKIWKSLAVSTQYRNVTDGRIDG